jgi:hypothetical protein
MAGNFYQILFVQDLEGVCGQQIKNVLFCHIKLQPLFIIKCIQHLAIDQTAQKYLYIYTKKSPLLG